MNGQEMIAFFFTNLALEMTAIGLIIGLIVAFFNRNANQRLSTAEILLKYLLLFGSAIPAFYAFIMHGFFPVMTAQFIGWQPSPFQFEVAMANLSIAVVCLLGFRASIGFRAAAVTTTSVFLLGAALGHIHQMITTHNFAPGNAGSIFFNDIILPVLLLILLASTKKNH